MSITVKKPVKRPRRPSITAIGTSGKNTVPFKMMHQYMFYYGYIACHEYKGVRRYRAEFEAGFKLGRIKNNQWYKTIEEAQEMGSLALQQYLEYCQENDMPVPETTEDKPDKAAFTVRTGPEAAIKLMFHNTRLDAGLSLEEVAERNHITVRQLKEVLDLEKETNFHNLYCLFLNICRELECVSVHNKEDYFYLSDYRQYPVKERQYFPHNGSAVFELCPEPGIKKPIYLVVKADPKDLHTELAQANDVMLQKVSEIIANENRVPLPGKRMPGEKPFCAVTITPNNALKLLLSQLPPAKAGGLHKAWVD
ncbi:MAG: hypothetical protein IAB19_09345 [Proteobacteria bacterium]|uniref:Uncharacterized protein n=1 Tax=Candidatus Avisuccinivibrio stercorigallinarum TaxID=2840704 RepID=A0A9D9GRB2_9GAMM|nr:hypothetical protein [Candidatus Avisuccinivibrio stercorigallinarum]